MKLLDAIDDLNVHERDGRKSPHKPLLLLYALARQFRNPDTKFEFKFVEIEEPVKALLKDFSNSKQPRVHYPFWRLRKDSKIWEVHPYCKIKKDMNKSKDARVGDLRKYNATGSFSQDIVKEIKNNPDVARQAAGKLLYEYFPKSLRQDILERVGFDYMICPPEKLSDKKLNRDRKFRKNVLDAYKYRCAMCGFDLHIDSQSIGLEAAHIKWHGEGGPDTLDNGLALCATHHKLFDLGAFTLLEDHRIVLSKWIHSPNSGNNFVEKYQKQKIELPSEAEHYPSLKHIRWHWREVFKGVIKNGVPI